MTHVNIYDGSMLIGTITDEPRKAWEAARACINSLANDAGHGRSESSHREWYRTPGRNAYQRSGFRAVNTFRR